MPVLNTCCCCFTTRTGTFIIGILQLIGSLLMIGGSILCLASWETIAEEFRKQATIPQDEMEQYLNFLHVIFIIMVVVGLTVLFIASLLIHGVRKMIPGLLMPYMIVAVICLVVGVIMDIVFIVKGGGIAAGLISMAISTALGVYFLLVVYSHYQELKDRDGRAGVPSDSKF